MTWDPGFPSRSPLLEPLLPHAAAFAGFAQWPPRASLEALLARRAVTNARGTALRAVEPEGAGALSYENRVFERGELEVHERHWHDFFNVLAWSAYPRCKAALNARHVQAAGDVGSGAAGNRGRVRDALTLFDENGAIVVASDADLLDDLRAFRWKTLFWDKRDRVRRAMRVFVVGHALLEKALAPYVGMTAHALLFRCEASDIAAPGEQLIAHVDALAARRISDPRALETPHELAPLPVLGVPGWWPANEREDFYDDTRYFRPGRSGRNGPG